LYGLPFVGVLIVGFWANFHLIGWTGLAVAVAIVELLALYGMELDRENRRRAREREQERQEGG
jgi:hypothetical protein